ncbi:hypothetical protein [Streptomyces sp. NPDC002588]|uniref:hypothetical protein n=1 Tax=Streptomyces sp. NPDC002588 TaxID=3154419 RepID=UPI0033216987
MGIIVITGTLVLVVLGFGNHLYWLAAIIALYLYVRSGRGSASSTPGPTPGPGAAPTSYKAYRARRDLQAKWERRYERERGR